MDNYARSRKEGGQQDELIIRIGSIKQKRKPCEQTAPGNHAAQEQEN
ncbi:hypothetical protein ABT063_21050 [Streptomyces sp. NPDC002838]